MICLILVEKYLSGQTEAGVRVCNTLIRPGIRQTLLDTDDTHSDSPDGEPWIPPHICLRVGHTLLDTDDTHSDSPDG